MERAMQEYAPQMCVSGVQVAAERHSEELRAVCVDITANCLPDVLVRVALASETDLLIAATFLSS